MGGPALHSACLPEELPIDLDAALGPILAPLAAVLAVAVVGLAGTVLVQGRRIARLAGRLDAMTRGGDGRSLEAVIAGSLERVDRIGRDVDQLASRSAVMETDLRSAVQHVALLRYNPFEETGGNQSFALALMDANGNGLVVSSLHARAGTRIYGKTLVAGRAEVTLSTEESEAVRLALASPRRGG